jgi:CheY-like chemotaxis protein
VARVLIAEPYPEVRELLSLIVRRLGHTTVLQGRGDPPAGIDLLVAEPAARGSLALAHALRATRPDLPIVVVSFLAQPAAWTALGPAAYVLKPFTVAQLEAAVESALGSVQSSAA